MVHMVKMVNTAHQANTWPTSV